MQDECDPLGGFQCVKDHQKRETDRVGEHGRVLGVDLVLATRGRFHDANAPGILAPGVPRPQHVQAHAGNDRRQPPAEVLDATASERLSRSQASWTASSASLVDPSIR